MYTSVKDNCKSKIFEAQGILSKYISDTSDFNKIISIISDAYFQLYESYRIQHEFEEVIRSEFGNVTYGKLAMLAIKKEGKHLEETLFDGSEVWYDMPD